MTPSAAGPATALAADATPTRPPIGEDAGAYGGKGSGAYTKQIRRGLYELLADGGKLTPKRVEAMRQHYQLAACLLVLTLPLIDAEATVEHEDEDIAAKLQESWDEKSLDVMRALAKALWAGYSPSTLRWEYSEDLGMLRIDRIRDLQPDTCTALTDDAGAFAGLLQKVPGGDEVLIDNPLQCLWVTEGMESGNLYGRSLLRAALDPWKDSLAWRIKHLLFGERFGEPVVRTRYPEGQRVANQQDINTALAANVDPPDPVIETNQATALAMGEALSNHAVLALNSEQHIGPDGKAIGYAWDVDFLESSRDNGQVFIEALDRADRAMARALFIPDTLFANPDTGTYALGRAHRSIFDSSTEGRLSDYGRQLTAWVVDRERAVNWPNAAPARLVFSGVTDTDSEKLWALAQTLVAGGRLPVDVEALATDLGIPLLTQEEQPDPEPAPEPVPVADPPTEDAVPPADDAALAHHGHHHNLAKDIGDTSTLPTYAQPQTTTGYGRALNRREQRVPFGKIEGALDDAEADAITQIVNLLGVSRETVLRQIAGIMGKATRAEQLAGIDTIDLKLGGKVASVWETLIRAIWTEGLTSVQAEIAAVSTDAAEKVPTTLGPEARAIAKVQATSAAEAQAAKLLGNVRAGMLNAVRSGVGRAGVEALVSALYEKETTSEAATPRLATRTLASQALNGGRQDAVERGGVRLRGAQYSAILDKVTCPLCERLDEQQISITNTDFARYTPPCHHNCRCLWIFVTGEELDFEPDWVGAPKSLVDANGGLVIG